MIALQTKQCTCYAYKLNTCWSPWFNSWFSHTLIPSLQQACSVMQVWEAILAFITEKIKQPLWYCLIRRTVAQNRHFSWGSAFFIECNIRCMTYATHIYAYNGWHAYLDVYLLLSPVSSCINMVIPLLLFGSAVLKSRHIVAVAQVHIHKIQQFAELGEMPG